MEQIYEPWSWYVAGPMITLVMFLLIYLGGKFGMSSNLRTICAMAGADRISDYFRFDWQRDIWNLVVIIGAGIGGYIAYHYLSPDLSIELADHTVQELQKLGFSNPGSEYLPPEIFDLSGSQSGRNIILLFFGGLLVGFGARYAGGCTSGHAISGLSNLQWPSLIAVIGFFIGGLVMVHLLLPLIF